MRNPQHSLAPRNTENGVFLQLGILLSLVSVPLLGLCAFHADQWRRSYRFLADHGVPPRYVWLSRQLMAFGPPVLLLLASLLTAIVVASLLRSPVLAGSLNWVRMTDLYTGLYAFGYFILAIVGFVVLGITVGQLSSMLLRSGFLAGILSVLLTGLLAGWCGLMWVWNVSWLWSVLPIPLVLLLVTRLRTRDWLLERNTLRAWLPPALVLIIPTAAILTAVPLYRVYSVPLIDPGFSLAEYDRPMTPEERATLELYQQASMRGTSPSHKDFEPPTHAEEIDWINRSQKEIALALKVSERKYSPLVGERLRPYETVKLADLLIRSAAKIEEEGKLDAAFQQYMAAIKISKQLRAWYPIGQGWGFRELHSADRIEIAVYARLPAWAANAGQTPERILAAMRQLEQVTSDIPTSDGIKMAHCRLRRFLMGDLEAISDVSDLRYVPTETFLWLRLPWERARAVRVLDAVTHSQLNWLSITEQAARRGRAFPQPPPGPREHTGPWFREMDFPYALQKQVYVPPVCYPLPGMEAKMVRAYTAVETSRRTTRLVMALEAWKLEHGSLPKSLDQLVGPCLDRLPVDPYSGQPFHYFRDGLKMSFSWSQPMLAGLSWAYDPEVSRGTIAAGGPFVWSTGEKIYYDASAKDGSPAQYQFYNDMDEHLVYGQVINPGRTFRWTNSMFEVWASGWPFPIP